MSTTRFSVVHPAVGREGKKVLRGETKGGKLGEETGGRTANGTLKGKGGVTPIVTLTPEVQLGASIPREKTAQSGRSHLKRRERIRIGAGAAGVADGAGAAGNKSLS